MDPTILDTNDIINNNKDNTGFTNLDNINNDNKNILSNDATTKSEPVNNTETNENTLINNNDNDTINIQQNKENNQNNEEKTESLPQIENTENLKEINKNKLVFDSLETAFEKINNLKTDGNKYFKENNLTEACKIYEDCLNNIQENLEQYEGYHSNLDTSNINELLVKIKEQRVLVMSNLSNTLLKQQKYLESFNLDLNIITQYNPNWDKSYNRIIISCIKRNDLIQANNYATVFKSRFQATTIDKYAQTFKELEQANLKQYETASANKTHVNSETSSTLLQNEVEAKTVIKKNNSNIIKKKSNYRMFFGSLMFIGSAIGLFILYSNKKRYFN